MKMMIYLEGRHACRDGTLSGSCPYRQLHDERRRWWMAGWMDEFVGAPLASDDSF